MKKSVDSNTPPADREPESPTSDAGNGHGLNSKSRNARAQARHRAKRKAYIEQLEESVTQLQAALTASKHETAGGAGPSNMRMLALEQENSQLRQEIHHLRIQIADMLRSTSPSQRLTPPLSISSMTGQGEDYSTSRDTKRRKRSLDESFSVAPLVPTPGNGIDGGPMTTQALASLSHARADPRRLRPAACFPTNVAQIPQPLQRPLLPSAPDTYFRAENGNHINQASTLYSSAPVPKLLDTSYQIPADTVPSYQNVPAEMYEHSASNNSVPHQQQQQGSNSSPWQQFYIPQNQPPPDTSTNMLAYPSHLAQHVRPFHITYA